MEFGRKGAEKGPLGRGGSGKNPIEPSKIQLRIGKAARDLSGVGTVFDSPLRWAWKRKKGKGVRGADEPPPLVDVDSV